MFYPLFKFLLFKFLNKKLLKNTKISGLEAKKRAKIDRELK